jgi:hypothetical protein
VAARASSSKVIFHPASAIDTTSVGQVQADLRRHILCAFVGRGLLESFESNYMLGYQHCGFSVDASVYALPRHAGLLFGMTITRRWMVGSKPSRNGT